MSNLWLTELTCSSTPMNVAQHILDDILLQCLKFWHPWSNTEKNNPWLLATCLWKRLHKINIWFSFCPLSVPCSSLFKLLLEEKRGGGEKRNKLITHKAPEALVPVLTVLQVLGGKAKWNFTKGKRVAYDLFVIGMTAKGHKTVEIITGCLGWQMPRISKKTCMAGTSLHPSLWPAASNSGWGCCGYCWGQQSLFQEVDLIFLTTFLPLFYGTVHFPLGNRMLKQNKAKERY